MLIEKGITIYKESLFAVFLSVSYACYYIYGT